MSDLGPSPLLRCCGNEGLYCPQVHEGAKVGNGGGDRERQRRDMISQMQECH